MYKEVAEYTKEGNLWEFWGKNMTFGQKASLYWAFGAGRFWQTAGLPTTSYMVKSICEQAGFKCGLVGTTGNMIGEKHIPSRDVYKRQCRYRTSRKIEPAIPRAAA